MTDDLYPGNGSLAKLTGEDDLTHWRELLDGRYGEQVRGNAYPGLLEAYEALLQRVEVAERELERWRAKIARQSEHHAAAVAETEAQNQRLYAEIVQENERLREALRESIARGHSSIAEAALSKTQGGGE